MSEESQTISFEQVSNAAVSRTTTQLFIAALGFFLITIWLGFENALITGELPQWQLLTHLHAGALGWMTLSVLAIAIWVFTGERAVSDRYASRVRILSYLAIITVIGYVASFAIAFTQQGAMYNLLPIGGGSVLIVLWAATGYALLQLRQQSVVTATHVFMTAALFVASIGGTMGVLIGLNYAVGSGISNVGAHAPVMLFYLLLVGSAVVEWVVAESHGRFSRSALAQALVLVIAGLVPPIAISLDLMMLMPIMLLGLILFLLLFLVRVGWKALYTNPFNTGERAWTFFGTIWLILVILVFPAEIAIEPPDWFLPVVAHIGFLGMATNYLLAILSKRTNTANRLHELAEPSAMWLLNLGILAFIVVKITMDTRHGAFVMGIGALLAVIVMLYRLLS